VKTLLGALGTTGVMALACAGAHAAIDDAKATEIMNKSGCAACHAVDRKIVGPAYQEVAAKRKGAAGAAAVLEKSVREGSKGVYGAIPMPPNPEAKMSAADLHDMVEWILGK